MSKDCPKCGKEVPDDALFCMNCGYSFDTKKSAANSNPFSNGTIFLILIAAVLLIGGIFILTSGFGTNTTDNVVDNVEHVSLTITGVDGWEDDSDKKSYSLYTNALFNDVPKDMKGYIVKTSYLDENDTLIGQETEKLEQIYYDSEYALSFGYYTAYKLPNPDHVKVEIIKDGKVIDNYTSNIKKNKIDYLN